MVKGKAMSKMIFVNLPVRDLPAFTAFHIALEALPPDRRPIGEPDFAADLMSESEFADYFYPKVAPKAKVFTVAPSINTYRMSFGTQWTPVKGALVENVNITKVTV
jgi:hypothetical protein